MRILDVSPRLAYPMYRGSSVRNYNLMRNLARGHQVRQFCQLRWHEMRTGSCVEEVSLGPSYHAYHYNHPLACAIGEIPERTWVSAPVWSGRALSITRPRLLTRLLKWADLILVEFPWQFEYCRRIRPDATFVLASHNIETDKFADYIRASGLSRKGSFWLNQIEHMERQAVKRADLILAVSPSDRLEFIERYGADPSRVLVVPNGADIETYAPVDNLARSEAKRNLKLPAKPTVVFVGNYISPNLAGFQWIKRVAKQAPQFTFLVIGCLCRKPYVDDNLIVTGRVADYSSYQEAADFGICPIRHGGGTKIKLLEYLAGGLPTVAFSESLHGTGFRDGEHLLISEPDEEAILIALNRLVRDRDLAARLGAAGRRYVVEHYDWKKIAGKLESDLAQYVEEKGVGGDYVSAAGAMSS